MKRVVFILLCLIAACSEEPKVPYPPVVIHTAGERAPATMPTAVVSVWSQQHEFLPFDAIFDGCDFWEEAGVACMSSGIEGAKIRIYVDESACTVENDLVNPDTERRILGRAWYATGDIMLYARCFFQADYVWYHQGLRNLVAHEVGHTLGITHAAPSCTGEILSWTDQGVAICGRAIMNPSIDYRLTGLTGVDHQAFQHRTRAGALGSGVEVLESP